MTGLDREIAAITEALTFRLRNRDQYPDDPELFAKEFTQALLGRGWRPTEAGRHDWHDLPKGVGTPHSEESKQAVAELRERLTRLHD